MRRIVYYLVVIIGLLQIIGYVTKIQSIRNLGIVTCASPLPIVFTEVKGVETFASDFYLRWTDDNSKEREVKITPALYSKFKGAYNRRNIYGAAISYGPVLPEEIWKQVLQYGLCNDILSSELGVNIDKESFSVYIKTRTEGRDDEWILKTNCD